jgi:hypothetical protein
MSFLTRTREDLGKAQTVTDIDGLVAGVDVDMALVAECVLVSLLLGELMVDCGWMDSCRTFASRLRDCGELSLVCGTRWCCCALLQDRV